MLGLEILFLILKATTAKFSGIILRLKDKHLDKPLQSVTEAGLKQ